MSNPYVLDPRVQAAVSTARTGCQGKPLSDLVDADGHQYVDFVMEGGGVLGISLLGYAYVLEQAGLRFLGVGGTSAGSIVALVLAALGPSNEPKAERAVGILDSMPMMDFIDGDADARDLTRALLEKAGPFKLGFKAAQCVDNLREDLGLHPGNAFLKWLTGVLAAAGVSTLADLDARIKTVPRGLVHRPDRAKAGKAVTGKEGQGMLVVVAADVTTETKVEFPRMAGLYWKQPDKVNPAEFARASMSIPFFFHPYRRAVPQGEEAKRQWETMANWRTDQPLPKECMFMDGGIMSNFPIDVFHVHGQVPKAPTFGAKIGFDRELGRIAKPSQLLGKIFNSARHTLDYDFILKNPDYKHLVAYIDVEHKHNWLNFEMQQAEKIELFVAGAQEAARFLCSFDWTAYKTLRAAMAKVDALAGA